MKTCLALTLSFLFMQCDTTTNNIDRITMPREEFIESFFGEEIMDPYRNLENLEDSLILAWIQQQKLIADQTIYNLEKRDFLLKEITTEDQKESFKVTKSKTTNDGHYFYLKKNQEEKVAKLYFRKEFGGKEVMLFDPSSEEIESLDKDYSINYLQPSWDAKMVVVGFTENDKEFSTLRIIDVNSKKMLEDKIDNSLPNSLGGIEWLPDNSGFIYTYVPVIDNKKENYLYNSEAVIYKIGQKHEGTRVVFSKKNNPGIGFKEESFPLVHITDPNNEITLGINATGTSRYRDTYFTSTKELENPVVNWKPFFKKEDKISRFDFGKENFYFQTSKGASNFMICKTSLKSPDFQSPTVLVKPDPLAVITDFTVTNKGLFYVKTKNGVEAKLYHVDNNGTEKEIKLPKSSGYINIWSNGYAYSDLWVEIEGWTSRKERYKYDFENDAFHNASLNPIKKFQGLNGVVVEEIEIPSHDGVMVPLSIIYKKGNKNKTNRLLINAYGAYKWSNTPFLYNYLHHWVKEGGVYAVAHVRGGGEKGDQWHKAGLKTTKPNTWKDLIASVEYLVDKEYVSKEKIVAWGASAGGVCIGRAITERPDLFSAAVIRAGVLNPLRREFTSNGKNNTQEYGTTKDSTEFKALQRMDAYHHVKKGIKYPALYLVGGMNDSRLPIWQTSKFAALVQELTASDKPVLMAIDSKTGHGFESSQNKQNIELANIMSFAFWQTGHPEFQPKK